MKETSRISSSRTVHGSRPRTFNSPSYEVSPRIALSAVVLPAPFGPIKPRMRPSSTRKSIPSSSTVVPKVLRSPDASIVAIESLQLCGLANTALRRRVEFFLRQPEPLDLFRDPGPLVGEKLLAFALQQQIARAGFDEHTQAAFHLDQLLIDQLLTSFQHRQRIDPIIRRHIAHRRQRIAFLEDAVQNHMRATITKLAINRLMIIPFTIHSLFQASLRSKCVGLLLLVTFSVLLLSASSPPAHMQAIFFGIFDARFRRSDGRLSTGQLLF